MNPSKKLDTQERRKGLDRRKVAGGSRFRAASHESKPISSYPEADPPSAKPEVAESDLKAYAHEVRKRHAIVSIKGEDVKQDSLNRRSVA